VHISILSSRSLPEWLWRRALLLNLGFFGEETPQERLDLTNPTLRVIYRVVRTQGFVFLSLSESLKALRIRPFLSRFLALNGYGGGPRY